MELTKEETRFIMLMRQHPENSAARRMKIEKALTTAQTAEPICERRRADNG